MPLLSLLRRLPVVPRALPTRRWPPRKLRSPAAMPPTRRSTGCSVVQSRSKSLSFTRLAFALKKRRASRGVFFRAVAPRGRALADAAQIARRLGGFGRREGRRRGGGRDARGDDRRNRLAGI